MQNKWMNEWMNDFHIRTWPVFSADTSDVSACMNFQRVSFRSFQSLLYHRYFFSCIFSWPTERHTSQPTNKCRQKHVVHDGEDEALMSLPLFSHDRFNSRCDRICHNLHRCMMLVLWHGESYYGQFNTPAGRNRRQYKRRNRKEIHTNWQKNVIRSLF